MTFYDGVEPKTKVLIDTGDNDEDNAHKTVYKYCKLCGQTLHHGRSRQEFVCGTCRRRHTKIKHSEVEYEYEYDNKDSAQGNYVPCEDGDMVGITDGETTVKLETVRPVQ